MKKFKFYIYRGLDNWSPAKTVYAKDLKAARTSAQSSNPNRHIHLDGECTKDEAARKILQSLMKTFKPRTNKNISPSDIEFLEEEIVE